ncbi:MAG TPA: cell division protein FtsH, partial [Candidatus Moranbacteria bacterium]|nr:cell division protein FtsH [Candidatus Moranbacteria bacterium]
AGHALVAASLKNADPVHKVSIISRGQAGGYTLAVPSEDVRLHSRGYFVDELATLLGGYASEK